MNLPDRIGTTMFYVYELVDPRDQLPYYVGVTTNPEVRVLAHVGAAYWRRESNKEKAEFTKAILAAGLRPTLQVVASFPEESVALRYEFSHVTNLRKLYPERLTNRQTTISGKKPTHVPSRLQNRRHYNESSR